MQEAKFCHVVKYKRDNTDCICVFDDLSAARQYADIIGTPSSIPSITSMSLYGQGFIDELTGVNHTYP